MAKAKVRPIPDPMTEARWLAATDPVPMAEVAVNSARATPRVLRLYLVAFWHWQSFRQKTAAAGAVMRKKMDVLEAWAETGKAPARRKRDSSVFFHDDPKQAFTITAGAPTNWGKTGTAASAVQPGFLRDLFGPHPFRPVGIDPDWLTSTAVQLATGIYADRAFDRLPILADALMGAGCDDPDLLAHCRGDGPHARGCWVVDLVLGKT